MAPALAMHLPARSGHPLNLRERKLAHLLVVRVVTNGVAIIVIKSAVHD